MMERVSSRLLWGLGWVGLLLACGGPPAEPATPVDGPGTDPASTPDDSDAVAEGEDAIKAQDFEKAKKIFGDIVQRRPDHAKANHYLAVALENLGDASGAEKHYRAALASAPTLTDAALNLSALLIDAKKFEDAAKVLSDTAKRNPKDPALQINLAYARMGMNDIPGAEAAFAAALAINDTADARLGLAELQLSSEKTNEALPNIEKAMQLAPDNVDVLAMSAELFRKSRSAERCIAAYDKAIALKPVAQLYANRGVCKQMKKEMPGAKADYQKAIEVDSSFAPAHFLLGRFLLSVEKNRKAAIEAFEACAKVAPESKCAQAAEQARNQK
jgi:Tfp pilus assembly protein PilF